MNNFPNCPPDVCGGGYIDSSCVLYHLLGQSPTRLINLGLPNGSSCQLIFDTIDRYLGQLAGFNGPITPVSTNAIKFQESGIGGRTLTPTLLLASGTTASPNIASILTDGLFVPDLRDWKVKINASDYPDYLNNKLIGGIDPSGIVSITTGIDPSGNNLVAILPDINVVALADNSIFDAALANNENFLDDLANSSFFLTSLVSPNSGNIIKSLSNGLYASGGTVAGADNGLSVSGSDIQLGGLLIQNTSIDFASIYQLSFINSPKISIGSASGITSYLSVIDSDPTIEFSSIFSTLLPFSVSHSYGTNYSTMNLTGGPVNQGTSLFNFALGGQLNVDNNGGDITLASGLDSFNTGIYGIFAKLGTGNILGANTISGGYFQVAAQDSGNISNAAGVRINGVVTNASGSDYTGTITNYYGLRIEDITNSDYGSNITNSFAIYQVGTSDISRFFGPVQNAGGALQFTSDERVKENFQLFERGLNEIEKINTRTFNYTYNKKKIVTGIIAQELETIIPEAVEKINFDVPGGEKYTDFRMVDQTVIFYTMLNAIKDLKKLNDGLKFRIESLESKIGKIS